MASGADMQSQPPASPPGSSRSILSLPPRWMHLYDDFITKNAHQVSQIESALRSLTYIIPGMAIQDGEAAATTRVAKTKLPLTCCHDVQVASATPKLLPSRFTAASSCFPSTTMLSSDELSLSPRRHRPRPLPLPPHTADTQSSGRTRVHSTDESPTSCRLFPMSSSYVRWQPSDGASEHGGESSS